VLPVLERVIPSFQEELEQGTVTIHFITWWFGLHYKTRDKRMM